MSFAKLTVQVNGLIFETAASLLISYHKKLQNNIPNEPRRGIPRLIPAYNNPPSPVISHPPPTSPPHYLISLCSLEQS